MVITLKCKKRYIFYQGTIKEEIEKTTTTTLAILTTTNKISSKKLLFSAITVNNVIYIKSI